MGSTIAVQIWYTNGECGEMIVDKRSTIRDLRVQISKERQLDANTLEFVHCAKLLADDNEISHLDLKKSPWIICSEDRSGFYHEKPKTLDEQILFCIDVIGEMINNTWETREAALEAYENNPLGFMEEIWLNLARSFDAERMNLGTLLEVVGSQFINVLVAQALSSDRDREASPPTGQPEPHEDEAGSPS